MSPRKALSFVGLLCLGALLSAAEKSIPVDVQTPEQREATLRKMEEQFARLGAGGAAAMTRFRQGLEGLPPEQRDHTLDLLAEIQERREKIPSETNELNKARLRSEVRELSGEFIRGNRELAKTLFQGMRAGRDRLDFSQGLSQEFPQESRFQRGLAEDRLDTGDPKGALEAALRAVELEPAEAQTYAVMAKAKQELGDYDGANADARRALELAPNNPAYRSLLRLTETRAAPSRTPAPEAGTLAPGPGGTDEDAGGTLSLLRPRAGETGDPFAAPGSVPPAGMIRVEDFERSRRAAAEAERLLRVRRYDEALRKTDEALSANPQNAAAIYTRAWAHLQQRQYALAQADIEAGLRLAPTNARMLSLYSRILSHQRRYGEALEAAQAAIRAEPGLAEAHYHKAFALSGLGRHGDTVAALAEAARLGTQYEPVYRKALQLPEDADLTGLFTGEGLPQSAAPASSTRGPRFLLIGIATLVGGFLLALGLLHVLSGGWLRRRRPQTTRSRARAGSAEAARPAGEPTLVAGTYEVRRRLGIGGMGVVYEAFDRQLHRRVAVKKMREEIRSDPREAARFLQEARMVAALHHPNIVEIYAIVEDAGDIYLVFYYVDGKTLHELIDDKRRLPFAEALRVMAGVCPALDYAHGKNIIHRDLKPSNIMLDKDGSVKVMDFGVARQAKDSMTRLSMTNTVVGTPPYMAPEQEQGAVCKESDVYALAVCLYETVCGELPFTGAGAAMLLSKMNKTYAPASRLVADLPSGFDEVLARALEPDPALRIRSAGEFLRELSGLVKKK